MVRTPEDEARETIDAALAAAGWAVQDARQVNLQASRGIAIRNFPLTTGHGFADYLLYVDGRAAGVVEAKKVGATLIGVETQTGKYSSGIPAHLPRAFDPLPFLYESTGVETRFTNLLDPEPRSRPVFHFHRPEELADELAGEPLDSRPANLQRGAGGDHESAFAPSGLPDGSDGDSPGLKPQALRPGPVGAERPDKDTSALLYLSGDRQARVIWENLVGMGPLRQDNAIRTAAGFLRYEGLVDCEYLRTDSLLWHAIAAAIDLGVEKGLFDRPRRGEVRALLPDARDYSLELWSLCLLVSMDFGMVDEDQALRAAAEEARKRMGLKFERLRSDGVILQGLREALEDEVKQGHIRRQGGKVGLTPVEELEKLMDSEREPQGP